MILVISREDEFGEFYYEALVSNYSLCVSVYLDENIQITPLELMSAMEENHSWESLGFETVDFCNDKGNCKTYIFQFKAKEKGLNSVFLKLNMENVIHVLKLKKYQRHLVL